MFWMQLKYRGCGNTTTSFSLIFLCHGREYYQVGAPEASFGFVDSTNVVATASMSAKVTASVYISDQSPFTGTFLRLTCDGVKVSYRLAREAGGKEPGGS